MILFLRHVSAGLNGSSNSCIFTAEHYVSLLVCETAAREEIGFEYKHLTTFEKTNSSKTVQNYCKPTLQAQVEYIL